MAIDYPRLCGGTFFTLLLQTLKQRRKARDRYGGGSDGLSDHDVLIGLIRVAQPQYLEPAASTFAQNTSAYKSCSISAGTYLPFNEAAFTDSFDVQVKTNYPDALAAMSGFVEKFIDTDNMVKCERLIKALLELIETDASITNKDVFYVSIDGRALGKAAVCALTDIFLQPFLLGVWHFIIMNRQDNTVGRSTFEQWHKAPGIKGQQWQFISHIGEGVTRCINVTALETGNNDIKQEAEDAAEGEPSIECGEPFAEEVDEDDSSKTTSQTVNNPFVFNQRGNNNIQIGKVDTLTINNS